MPFTIAVKPGVHRAEEAEKLLLVGLIREVIEDQPAFIQEFRAASG
jgi:hypothetical protein